MKTISLTFPLKIIALFISHGGRPLAAALILQFDNTDAFCLIKGRLNTHRHKGKEEKTEY